VCGRGSFLFDDDEWKYIIFTGRCTGFCFWKNKEQAEIEKTELENLCNQHSFDKKFHIEYIGNINKIPMGKLKIEKIQKIKILTKYKINCG